MKKSIFNITIFTFITVISGSLSYCQTIKDIKLNRIKNFPKNISVKQGDNNPLEASVIIDDKQPLSGKGLKFSIKLVNHSNNNRIVHNILDGLHLTVHQDDPNALIPPPLNYTSKEFRKGQKWMLGEIPFEIEDFYINDQKQNIDLRQTEKITIPKGGSFIVNLSVLKVYDKKLTKKESFKKGRYRLYISMGVNSWTAGNSAFYDRLEIPQIIIDYGL